MAMSNYLYGFPYIYYGSFLTRGDSTQQKELKNVLECFWSRSGIQWEQDSPAQLTAVTPNANSTLLRNIG